MHRALLPRVILHHIDRDYLPPLVGATMGANMMREFDLLTLRTDAAAWHLYTMMRPPFVTA